MKTLLTALFASTLFLNPAVRAAETGGVGAILQETKEGQLAIGSLMRGGPADKGGLLKKGDVLLSIREEGGEPVSLAGLDTEAAAKKIRGEIGTTLTFKVKLLAPIAMEQGLNFAIREGGRTVGAGVVTSITK